MAEFWLEAHGLFVALRFFFLFDNQLVCSVCQIISCAASSKMAGSVDVLAPDSSINGTMKPLPEVFNSTAFITDHVHVPLMAEEDDIAGKGEAQNGTENGERNIVLGRNIHTMCLEVSEPDIDDEVTGEREAYMASVLAKYKKSLTERTKYHLGYPYNLDFDYEALSQLQHFSINNLGDPFIESNYGVHSRQFEVGVLDWFARLWELEKDEYWGYITNCGTEGNLHGILVGREVFPDGILYASEESHYSVFKAARMYRMECVKIDTLCSGEIDCDDFKAKLLCHKDKPAIVNVNIGTTVKGAVDDLDLVIKKIEEAGFSRDSFYIHCDGALFGLMLPFVKRAPKVSFKKPIGSVSVSGHKFVGSRNGHAPIFLWYSLNMKGYRGLQKEVQKCLRNAHYFKGQLVEAGIGAMVNELSSTVVFERPHDEEFVHKWQLACQGNIAHVVVMPNVTIEKLHDFLNELLQKRQEWFRDGKCQPRCIASAVGHENCLCFIHR
ncbi:serine decarboxylase 1-like isoform X1 [Phaseolus vulgaris]|uniref:Serine decarboxylase n=2 Tax=Phaseolus vulgaris TaxID=3885 RepID=V7CNW6_PHAVU|nr:hypothetical protein PHAVU_002G204900g [Phaseolus vulgaris]ESW31053.1 hypothetical protein PHAVU_002G204900g [Phaseolus vulgaris]